ncbi:hypothetical protein [Caballeronia catudaia]|nr:hypothetical protein [Caballeronia catudaia]
MKRSIGVTALLFALGLACGVAGCASGTQSTPGSSGAPSAPAGGGSY